MRNNPMAASVDNLNFVKGRESANSLLKPWNQQDATSSAHILTDANVKRFDQLDAQKGQLAKLTDRYVETNKFQ